MAVAIKNTEFKNTVFGGNLSFITSWKTDNAGTSNNDQITIPTISTGTYNCNVNWGDGTKSFGITTYNDAAWTHTFVGGAGTYTVKITGQFEGIRFSNGGDRLKLLEIKSWGKGFRTGNVDDVFQGCKNLVITATDILNLTGITDISYMFSECDAIVTIPNLNNFDFSSIQNMRGLFWLSPNFNQDLSGLDVSSATNMIGTFGRPPSGSMAFDQDLSAWDVTSLTDATVFLQGATLSVTNYNNLLTGWEAQAVQNNVSFSGGNSKYTSNTVSVSSITRSGTTATVTTATPHGLSTSDRVYISGADQAEYNIVATVTVNSTTEFTYTVSGTPVTPATGTIIAEVSLPAIARQALVQDHTWTIVDGGAA